MNEPTAQLDLNFQGWHKSSYSQPNENDCVEVGYAINTIGVRNTRNRAGERLEFGGCAWSMFLSSVHTSAELARSDS